MLDLDWKWDSHINEIFTIADAYGNYIQDLVQSSF